MVTKSTLLSAFVFAVLSASPLLVQARQGNIVWNSDCSGNNRKFTEVYCGDNEVAVGVGYTDIHDKDVVDAVTLSCRGSSGSSNWVVTNDFQKRPRHMLECDSGETLVGIYQKGSMARDGKTDQLDGLTAICQKSGSDGTRRVPNSDIKGGREGNEIRVSSGEKIIGLAYKAMDNGKSDETDCVTVIKGSSR